MNTTKFPLALVPLWVAFSCDVPEVPQVSLYDQGSDLHGGSAAQQAAQGVMNGLELREVRQELVDFDTLALSTRCRLGVFRGAEEDDNPPIGFLVVDATDIDAELCDDLPVTEVRDRAGRAWLRDRLPYGSDVHAQSMQAEYGREYAHRIRELGIEAEEWSVPDELQQCIGDRVAVLSVHHSNIANLACQAYQAPSDADSDAYRSQLVDARNRADRMLEESRRIPPVVEDSHWQNELLWAEFEAPIDDFGEGFSYRIEATAPAMGFPVTLLRGETIRAVLYSQDRVPPSQISQRVGLWSVEREEWEALNSSQFTWTAPRTETYILAAEYSVSVWNRYPSDRPLYGELAVMSDGAGTLSDELRTELEEFIAYVDRLLESGSEALLPILRWENDAAQMSCVDAALLANEDYARHRAVDEALEECSWELRHRIETRARVLALGRDEEAAEN